MAAGSNGSQEAPSGRRPVRPPSLIDALIPLAALVALLSVSYVLFGDRASAGPNQIALLFCGIIAASIAYKNGMKWDGIRQAVVDGMATGLTAIMILLAVGALIGTWAMCGTIMSMVYYGLHILNPNFFFASTALICAIVGFSIGSSWTVAGTIGVGLMGVAASMGLSLEITAGAIISGSYFGDKASPLSDTANLATAVAGSSIYDHIRESLWTSVPALLIAVVGFSLLGAPGDFDATVILMRIDEAFPVSLWGFTPLLLVLAMAILRFPPFVTIFMGALAGGILAAIENSGSVIAFANAADLPAGLALVKGVWSAMAWGYSVESGDAAIDAMLSRGGMASMMGTVWLILTALAFGATVEHAGLLSRLIDPIIRRVRSVAGLVASLVGTCVVANGVTSDQYIAIALPGRLFRLPFRERGLAPVMLSRVVGDSATVTSPLIPWNSCGAYMAAALGVATTAFAGYCFFNLLNPVITILFTLMGWRVIRQAGDAGGK
ncbi:transporter (NhaC family) [Dongia mobilis]|uniref:Transporter (NhaC family) n=1 Tax=Dongia mobilis TaxID=578943 RepID=A0A4R6WV76_9PROT|nr:Na+/H+ antiporter NhaC family protein [Dongia mobilis]TDQ82982.1 transporter (NhaC family) [Dongia mobilis]